jgi:hypothetical protein
MAKKYSINIEDDQVISVEVDGVQYDSPDDILDPADRAHILRLMPQSFDEDSDKLDEAFEKKFKEDFAALDRQSEQLPMVVAGIFSLVAIILLSIAGFSGYLTKQAIAKEKNAHGQVIDLIIRKDTKGREYYYPVVEFQTENQQIQKVQLNIGSWPASYRQGEAVTILYNPEKPTQVRIKSLGSDIVMWLGTGITGFMGMIFATVALAVGLLLRPEKMGRKKDSF